MRVTAAVCFCVWLSASAGLADSLDVPITVRNDTELGRVDEIFSHGIPIPRGCFDDTELPLLFVTAPDGSEVPSQTRVLARWLPSSSVKHLLVTFPVSLGAFDEATYRLRLGTTPHSYTGRDAATDRSLVLQLFQTDGARAFVTDAFGTSYPLVNPTAAIEEDGPLRTMIRLDGYHQSGSGIGRDLLWSSAYFTFFEGVEAIRIDWTLKNSHTLRPIGGVAFRNFFLELRHSVSSPTAFLGDPPVEQGSLPAELSYLDATPRPLLFGWAGTAQASAAFAILKAWQTFPKSIAVDASFLRLWGLPTSASEYFLEDGQHVQFRTALILNHDPAAAVERAKWLERPLLGRLDGTYLQGTRAWGDFGAFVPVPVGDDLPFAGWNGLSYGWSQYGESIKSTHQGGSPRNRYSYLLNYLQTGDREDFDWVEDHLNVSMNLRPYHWNTLEKDFDFDEFPGDLLRGGTWLLSEVGPGAFARLNIPPAYDPWRTTESHGWNGWDFEHMTVDDVRDYYLVTGHPKALESLLEIAEGLRSYPMCFDPVGSQVHSARVMGWVLRTLIEAYRLSGQEKYFESASSMVRSALLRNGERWVFDERGLFSGSEPFIWGGEQRFGLHNNNEYRPWMSAVGGVGLMLYLELLEEREQTSLPTYFNLTSSEVRTFVIQTADLILDLGFLPGEGFVYLIDIYDDTLTYEGFTGGTATWNYEFLALVAKLTGNPSRYLAPARFGFEREFPTQDQRGNPWFQFLQETLNQPAETPSLYLSFASGFDLAGVGNVEPSDLVYFDAETQSFSMHFDGSDVGIASQSLSAFALLPNGWSLVAFDGDLDLPGLIGGPNGERVTTQDVVLFKPSQNGPDTAGSFIFIFDGSDVGLGAQDRIDAISFPFGALVVSFRDAVTLPGVGEVAEQDVAFFVPTGIGPSTSGIWGLAFDGSDVALESGTEDLNGVFMNNLGEFLITTESGLSGPGASGLGTDVFRFRFTRLGNQTAGTFERVLAGSDLGLTPGVSISGIAIR